MVLREISETDDPKVTADVSRMYCCGVAELYAVHSSPPEKIKELLQAAREQISVGVVLATTNPSQVDTVRNLEACGFKKIITQLNPRMGREFTLWMCDVSKNKHDDKLPRIAGVSTQTKARGVDNKVWIP